MLSFLSYICCMWTKIYLNEIINKESEERKKKIEDGGYDYVNWKRSLIIFVVCVMFFVCFDYHVPVIIKAVSRGIFLIDAKKTIVFTEDIVRKNNYHVWLHESANWAVTSVIGCMLNRPPAF